MLHENVGKEGLLYQKSSTLAEVKLLAPTLNVTSSFLLAPELTGKQPEDSALLLSFLCL